jgi:hypothetical protein
MVAVAIGIVFVVAHCEAVLLWKVRGNVALGWISAYRVCAEYTAFCFVGKWRRGENSRFMYAKIRGCFDVTGNSIKRAMPGIPHDHCDAVGKLKAHHNGSSDRERRARHLNPG